MDSCCGPSSPRDPHAYDAIFDARFSQSVARRYGRKGLRTVEREIVGFLESAGIDGASVLEIGGGIGEIQLELLKRGAAKTVNLELSNGYEDDAARLIEAANVRERVQRRVGVDLAEAADVVVLHRVVCCYPDYAKLLGAAAEHTKNALVFSYPTANLPSRAFIRLMNALLSASGRSFRGYIHPPTAMVDVVRSRGLEPVFRWHSPVWHIVGLVRADA